MKPPSESDGAPTPRKKLNRIKRSAAYANRSSNPRVAQNTGVGPCSTFKTFCFVLGVLKRGVLLLGGRYLPRYWSTVGVYGISYMQLAYELAY